MIKTQVGSTKPEENEKVQEDSPFRHLPYISDRIVDTVVDLIDDSYILLPDDEINVTPTKDRPMLTIEELAMVYARENSLSDIIEEPQVVFKVKGNANEDERIVAMVRGMPPDGGPCLKYWITSTPMDYFEDKNISITFVLTKDIWQFFIITGYIGILWEAEDAVRKAQGAGLSAQAARPDEG
jgi:hypothetical protein